MPQIHSHQFKDKKLKSEKIKTFKSSYLKFVFISSLITISISLFIPKYQDRQKFLFPYQVSLSNWQSKSSENLDKTSNNENEVVDARRYLYTSSTNEILKIDVFYVRKQIMIPNFLKSLGLKYSTNNANIRYSQKIGYYALFVDQEQAYLSACINPIGVTTVTTQQWTDNSDNYSFTSDRMISYLLGITYIRDHRCLLTVMSIPLENQKIGDLDNNLLDKSYQILEKTWINWYQKWENNFPRD